MEATFIGQAPQDGWHGDARHYSLSGGVVDGLFVVVSGIEADETGPAKTVVLAADPEGYAYPVLPPLVGSFVGGIDHERALNAFVDYVTTNGTVRLAGPEYNQPTEQPFAA